MTSENLLKKTISNLLVKIAEHTAYRSKDTTCLWWQYQPKEPSALKSGFIKKR